jgi:alpha-1,6-mannosyltransferase
MPSGVSFPNKKIFMSSYHGLLALVFVAAIFSMAYFYQQKDFFSIFPLYTLAFLAMVLLYQSTCSLHFLIATGLLARIALVFIFPALSDDIYRFFWDGRLMVSGISPYGILPADALAKNIPYLDKVLFDSLNSQPYYTIYPPVSQLFYAISASIGNIKVAAVVMKILFLLTEIVGVIYMIKLLKKIALPLKPSILFFLNPLVIIEGAGNLHFEVIMVSFLCISIYYIFNNKLIYGAFWMSASIGVKLLPLMILPYFWFRLNGKDKWLFFSSLIGIMICIFLPMAGGIEVISFLSSVDLYFRKFEFNAGIYYLLRYVGQQISGYNLISYIGPLLGLITLGYNLYWASVKKSFEHKDFIHYALLVWAVYLVLATTVHPWYVIPLLFFGIFTSFRYPLMWSYLIFISYINYSYPIYYENLWWISLEYSLLSVYIIMEYNIRKAKI